jgi:hypothetical protein
MICFCTSVLNPLRRVQLLISFSVAEWPDESPLCGTFGFVIFDSFAFEFVFSGTPAEAAPSGSGSVSVSLTSFVFDSLTENPVVSGFSRISVSILIEISLSLFGGSSSVGFSFAFSPAAAASTSPSAAVCGGCSGAVLASTSPAGDLHQVRYSTSTCRHQI